MMKVLQENMKSYFYIPKLGKSFPSKMQTWIVKEKQTMYSTILNLKTLYGKSIKTKIKYKVPNWNSFLKGREIISRIYKIQLRVIILKRGYSLIEKMVK